MKLLMLVLAPVLVAGAEGPAGGTSTESSCKVKPWATSCQFVSVGFPSGPPRSLSQRATVSLDKGPRDRAAIRLQCSQFEIPQDSDGGCGGSVLIVEDAAGRVRDRVCGRQPGLARHWELPGVSLVFESGPEGAGTFNCSLRAVLLGEAGQEVPSYLEHQFEEEDSSEHGLGPADRTTSCPCGWANKVVSRIVNGSVTVPNEFPYTAAIVVRENGFHFCGGSIITAVHVLTAAHCTFPVVKNNLPISVIVGAHDLNDKPGSGHSKLIDVDCIIEHEQYNSKNFFKNDISLLVLKREIQFTPFIGRVYLPSKQLDLVDETVKIVGWGSHHIQGEGSNVLMKVNVRVISMQQCRLVYRLDADRRTQICAYRTGRSSCKGDSGGPVLWLDPETNRYVLAGLVSFGKVCADTSPSVQTDVGFYKDWITKHIQESKPSEICTKT